MIEVRDIVGLLEDRAESLCWELFPNGRMEGRGIFRIGSLAGEQGQSLFVRVDGPKCGNWRDMAGGAVAGRDRGDLLWLIACAHFNGELGKAVAWAKSWLHLDDEDPARLARFKLEAKAAHEKRARSAATEEEQRRRSARKRWHQGVPIGGTMVEAYLRGREIDLRALGKTPGSLRFNPHVQHGYGAEALVLPAMVAQVNSLSGAHVATHRTWLVEEADPATGELLVRKAAPRDGVPKAKKVLGLYEGGHIALWKGACGTMPLRDVPPGTDVFVTEGIEDGLTVACADPSLRVVSGISVANIGALELPAQIGWLVIVGQNDPPGSDAERALTRAIGAQRARGVRVKVARPRDRAVKDVNALAMLELGEAA